MAIEALIEHVKQAQIQIQCKQLRTYVVGAMRIGTTYERHHTYPKRVQTKLLVQFIFQAFFTSLIQIPVKNTRTVF